MKHSNPYIFLKTVNNPPAGFCTNIFFAPRIILTFGGLFLYMLSRIIRVNIKWLRVPMIDLKKTKNRIENPKQSKPIWKARKKPPKATPRTQPLSTATFQSIGYDTYSPQELDTKKVSDLTMMDAQSHLITLQMHTYDHRKTCSMTIYIPLSPIEGQL